MIDLSIVIVNHNAGEHLPACLRSLFENPPGASWEVIVIDNASSDGSPDIVRREFPAARLIAHPANPGFAAACNLGARSSSSRYVLFLNPDTLVPPRTLDAAVTFMEAHGEAGVMGCRTIGRGGRLQPTAFGFPSPVRIFGLFSGLNRHFKVTRLKDHSKIRQPDYVQGSFLLVRRGVFESVNGFDESFFMYAEDVDLCLRVRRSGRLVYYVPDMTITHFGGGSVADSLTSLERYIRSLSLLYLRYRPAKELKKLRRAMRLGLRLRELIWAGRMSLSLKPLRKDVLRSYRNLISLSKSGQPLDAGPVNDGGLAGKK